MDKGKIRQKFGNDFVVSEATYVMGIHHLIAEKIAERFKDHKRVLDACAGAGFMGIAFAKYVPEVVAVDINPEHLKMAKQNAKIAGVQQKIKFVLGDVSSDEVLDSIGEIDGVNLDMDWAIGKDKKVHVTRLSEMQPPADFLFGKISKKTPNISIRLPRELNLEELKKLPECELEEIYLDGDFKFYMAYFGNLLKTKGRSRLEIFSKV